MPTLAPSHSKRKPNQSNWESYNKGKSRHERGYDSKWVKLRDRILFRDKGLCQPCLRRGIYTRATEVDHITEKARRGSDSPDNLQAICTTCHKQKTRRAGQRAGRGH